MKNILAIMTFCIGCFFVSNAQTVGMKITTNGDVGVGMTTPLEKLDVDGAIRVGSTTNANAGTIRFSGDCFQGYDGTSWVDLGGSGCGGSGPTCFDGIQNQGETGVDCGGPCAACSTGNCETIANISAVRSLPLAGWSNQYNVGGTGISGDGQLYFTLDAIVGNTDQVIGLSDTPNTNANKNTVDYGIRFYIIPSLNRYWYAACENGGIKGGWQTATTTFAGDLFNIEKVGTTVTYKQNGTVFYTSATSSSTHLYFDNSFYDNPNSGTWGLRPSSVDIIDIDLCPAGSTPAAPGPSTSKGAEPIQIDPSTIEQYAIELGNVEDNFLSLPSPNPFSDQTSVTFAIGHDYYDAELVFTDSYGRELGRQEIDSDKGVIEIQSSDLDSGIYQYSLVVDGEVVKTNKMVVVK